MDFSTDALSARDSAPNLDVCKNYCIFEIFETSVLPNISMIPENGNPLLLS